MVAKFVSGKTIGGVLRYNEHKVATGKAELIMAVDFTKDADKLTMSDKLGQFAYLTKKNTRTVENAIHISLNFDKADQLSKDQLAEIAQVYMQKIGFDGQPFLVYEHYDAAHQHVHIVTTNIKSNGNRIPLNNIGRDRSEPARKAIEIEYNLVKAEGKKQSDYYLKPVPLEKIEYGKSETKAAISNVVREVVKSYKYTSLAELNAVLKQYNVVADRGEPGTIMHEKKGLSYCLLDGLGNKVGVPIKASRIYGRPILSSLEQRFKANEMARKPLKQRLLYLLEKALSNPAITNRKEFSQSLAAQNIHTVFRESDQARLYGVTFVDNGTRVVFNGSELGKAYSANAISQRYDSPVTAPSDKNVSPDTTYSQPLKAETASSAEPTALGQLGDLLFAQDDNTDPGLFPVKKKRKKKRGQQQ